VTAYANSLELGQHSVAPKAPTTTRRPLLRTPLLCGNGADDWLPDDMPIHRSALHIRFFEQSRMPNALSVELLPANTSVRHAALEFVGETAA
jgi:hypothetical protein